MTDRQRALLTSTLAIALFGSAMAGSEEPRHIHLDHGAQNPALSPDDRSIAISLLGHLYVLSSAGGEARQITSGIGWDTHPAWSPDGRFLAYSHELPSGTELVALNLNTGTSMALYHTEFGIGQISYDPKGEHIYFLHDRNQLDCHLWRFDLADSKAQQITFTENWHEWSFALSPDGKEVFLDSGRYGGSNLYRLASDGANLKRLTTSPAHQTSVNWSRDGKTLAYVGTENGVDSVFVQPSDGGAARRVFSSPYEQKQLTVSRDGSWGVLSAARKLYRIDMASGQTTPLSLSAELALPAESKPDLILRNARLFSGTGNEAVPGTTIEVRDGKIASVHPDVAGNVAKDDGSIDAGGRFVMAGLIDNHYHYWDAFAGANLIRRGITSVRDPGVAISSSMTFREANELGVEPGPKIYSCGPLLDGIGGYHPMVDVELSTASAAAPVVQALKNQGVDCLKVYFLLAPDVLAEVIREAHQLKLPVTGHIGVRTGWGEALDANIDGLTHIRLWKDFLRPDQQPQGENETLDGARNTVARMQADWREIDPDQEKAGQLIERMRQHKIGFDPTLAIQKIEDPARARLSLEQFANGQDSFQRMSRFVARAFKAGIPILAGTDNGNLFDELEAYAAAGIPNAEVLRTATINGAKWLGKPDEFGTIEPGERADLLLIDGDPLANIKDIRKVSLVIQAGRVVFER